MTESPLLSEADVRLEVERLFRRDHRSKLLALFGRGQPGRFELDGLAWEIIPTGCELELRSKLPAPGEQSQAGSVYLVDWAEDALPLDVSCRLAGGRISRNGSCWRSSARPTAPTPDVSGASFPAS